MARASVKLCLLEQSKNSPTRHRAKPKYFYILSVTPYVRLLISLETIARRFTICPSTILLVMEVGRLRVLDKDSLCLGSQETAMDFFLGS